MLGIAAQFAAPLPVQQLMSPVHLLIAPRVVVVQETVRDVGSVSNIEENGSSTLRIVPDVVAPSV
jgi:hypothetical protein